jgi:hypothetical protein
MVSLEQVKLLETKVSRAIDYVERVTGENALLQGKLESYQKRIDELEVLVQRFKEDQGRIEDGILSALDRLNQFEDAIEKSLALQDKKGGENGKTAPKAQDEGPVPALPAEASAPVLPEEPDSGDTAGMDDPEPEEPGEDEKDPDQPEDGEPGLF